MGMKRTDTLSGKLLIAMPGIGDPRFEHAVILLCSHAEDHAMGVVLNKPVPGLAMRDVLEQLEIETTVHVPDREVLDGGPVGRDRGFVVHTGDYTTSDSTLEITENLCLTATREALHALTHAWQPARALLALGYAGWGEGQLEEELAGNVWLIADADPELVWDIEPAEKWACALDRLGIQPASLSQVSGRA